MTESEWLACNQTWSLHSEFLSILSDRKLRLFGAACLRRVWCLLRETTQLATEACEDYADGRIPRDELVDVWTNAELDTQDGLWLGPSRRSQCDSCLDMDVASGLDEVEIVSRDVREAEENPAWTAALAVFRAREIVAWKADAEGRQAALAQEAAEQYRLWRDVFDGPPSPRKLNPTWHVWKDGTLRRLAQSIYERRTFDHLPVLADALEDAGCTDTAMLLHCRGGGEHARGCWVVDLLLGRD